MPRSCTARRSGRCAGAGAGYQVVSDAGMLVGRRGRHRHRLLRPARGTRVGADLCIRRSGRSPPTGTAIPAASPTVGVLVVGASATGVQLADELAAAGRDVVLAVGRHTRVPRRYRGMDIMWWLDSMGVLDRPLTAAELARRPEPSLQIVGSTGRSGGGPALAGRARRQADRPGAPVSTAGH